MSNPEQEERVKELIELSKPIFEYLCEHQIDRTQVVHPSPDGKWVLQAFFAETKPSIITP